MNHHVTFNFALKKCPGNFTVCYLLCSILPPTPPHSIIVNVRNE
jgi:hypothetical protein